MRRRCDWAAAPKLLYQKVEKREPPDHHRRPGAERFSLIVYFSMTPQAIRSPEFPEGSDLRSSAFAWMTSDVPPSCIREFSPDPSETPSTMKLALALPLSST